MAVQFDHDATAVYSYLIANPEQRERVTTDYRTNLRAALQQIVEAQSGVVDQVALPHESLTKRRLTYLRNNARWWAVPGVVLFSVGALLLKLRWVETGIPILNFGGGALVIALWNLKQTLRYLDIDDPAIRTSLSSAASKHASLTTWFDRMAKSKVYCTSRGEAAVDARTLIDRIYLGAHQERFVALARGYSEIESSGRLALTALRSSYDKEVVQANQAMHWRTLAQGTYFVPGVDLLWRAFNFDEPSISHTVVRYNGRVVAAIDGGALWPGLLQTAVGSFQILQRSYSILRTVRGARRERSPHDAALATVEGIVKQELKVARDEIDRSWSNLIKALQ